MPLSKQPTVYILASRPYGTLYTGVTSDLHLRISQHAEGLIDGFSKRHCVTRLVYYEMHPSMEAAIGREKRLKRWNRAWKYRLIEQINPEWLNLHDAADGSILNGPSDARNDR